MQNQFSEEERSQSFDDQRSRQPKFGMPVLFHVPGEPQEMVEIDQEKVKDEEINEQELSNVKMIRTYDDSNSDIIDGKMIMPEANQSRIRGLSNIFRGRRRTNSS